MAKGYLDELQKAEKYPIRWSLLTGFTVLFDFSHGHQSYDGQSASEVTQKNIGKYFTWPYQELLLNTSKQLWSCVNDIFMKINSGILCQRQVLMARKINYIPQIMWDVITCHCPRYLLLVLHSPSKVFACCSGGWAHFSVSLSCVLHRGRGQYTISSDDLISEAPFTNMV